MGARMLLTATFPLIRFPDLERAEPSQDQVLRCSPCSPTLTLYNLLSTPGSSIMVHTSTPRKRKTVKRRRLTVEVALEGQQLHSVQGAEPQRQEACGRGEQQNHSRNTLYPSPALFAPPDPSQPLPLKLPYLMSRLQGSGRNQVCKVGTPYLLT